MYLIFRNQKLLLLAFFAVLSIHSDLSAGNDTVIKQQLLVALTIYGADTVFRDFNYYSNGHLHTIIDTPRTDTRATYHAEFDSTGKIRTLREFRSELINFVDYTWESDNQIKFTKKFVSSPEEQTGRIIYFGRLRSVDLPENNPLAPENFILVRADSTQYLDDEGKIITTWYWDYDSLDRCIRWRSSTIGGLLFVDEYTYGYYRGFPARYPALESDIVVFYAYDKRTGLFHSENLFSGNKVFKKWALSSDQFMLNGRKVRSVTTFPEIEKKSSLILIKQKDGKARIILPKSKR